LYCTIDDEEPVMSRVAINTHAPEFTLPDFNGHSVSLSDFKGRKNVLLVFNRGFA
jgi:peroxiredoxin